ncbi:MAG TPA: DUF4142 domain-containing protein [Candidatus Binatia bacterium]|nr:DUF4142 domain-containing protein [Candidatus Binatia bacterium]
MSALVPKGVLAAVFATLAVAAVARAQAGGTLTNQDLLFAHDAALHNASAIDLGRLASVAGTDPRVRAFGDRMVADHTAAQATLLTVSAAAGASLPRSLTAANDDAAPAPARSDPNFDRSYLQTQIDAHKSAIQMFKREAKVGAAAGLASFASENLALLRRHLRDAQRLKTQLAGAKGTAGGGGGMSGGGTGYNAGGGSGDVM